MNIDKFGAVFLDPEELFEAVYSGKIKNFENIYIDQKIVDKFNHAVDENKDSFLPLNHYQEPIKSVNEFDKDNQTNWFMPKDAVTENLVEMLYGMCTTEEQTNRVSQELELFIQHDMYDLLFYLKYLVDTMRQHKIVWGVGRGSSVASYVLFLIGIHKIDSIKYNLDIKEFLK
jgi:DNA polymerase III alpha subunit